MKRFIPSTMATQHPDNAGKPYWYHRPFVSSLAEIKESFLMFSDLAIDEYNWDWEGKFVDEAVIDRLLNKHYSYFQKNPIGEKKFLTFRFPNPRVEKQFRLARALMVAITSSQLAKSLSFRSDPIFEAILPLTETAGEIIHIQEAFKALVGIEHDLLKLNKYINHIQIIPLFESVSTIINSDNILREYFSLHQKSFGRKPEYLRPYIARSDPALNSGLVPTIIALKIALSKYQKLESETGIRLYPMLGTGSLPFRGSLSPDTVERALKEYAGIKTLIIQSAFRYDFPRQKVKQAIKTINQKLHSQRFQALSEKEIKELSAFIPKLETPYRKTIEEIAPIINKLSAFVAKRRERMQHIGLFGYNRGVGKTSLPRAITFTSVLYSIGVPPELIGSGRGLSSIAESSVPEVLSRSYNYLKEDMVSAGKYLNKNNLNKLAGKNNYWQDIKEDVKKLEKILKIELGPESSKDKEHQKLTAKILDKFNEGKNISQLITMSGHLRQSLG